MKILVFTYDLVVAGVPMNAIELTAALRDLHGHDVLLFAGPGPMLEQAEQRRLRFVPAPQARVHVHPSVPRMRALRELVRRERPDLIHVWDWTQCIDAFFVEHLLMSVPLIVTDMSMTLQRLLPRSLPTTFGTPELRDQALASGRRQANLLLPPVDVALNAPGAVDARPFREQFGIRDNEIVVVTVSRLDSSMKGESLFRTLDAVHRLGHELPSLRFVIVGDGDARERLQHEANIVNANLGRPAVVLTGAVVDPRPAYAVADIVLGMGGSALRGMAFGKPVIVVGVKGFFALFAPETAESFYYRGMYGIGDGSADNARLIGAIRSLCASPDQRAALGKLSRAFVVDHFSLETVSTQLDQLCRIAVDNQPSRRVATADGLRTAAVWMRERRWSR